jgi:hypothetical protein
MSDLADCVSQLAELWPALARALARDAAGADAMGTRTWTAATVVNADVLAAMITLGRDVPAVTRTACEAIAEPWQHRTLQGCLQQIPRLGGRMHDLGQAAGERRLTDDARGWLRITKRALGLRKPDIPLGYACPYADTIPENHAEARMLFMAGAEGSLRHDPDGVQVEWAAKERIYCASEDCGASWSAVHEWSLLGRMLGTPAMAS